MRHIVDLVALAAAAIDVAVEALEFREEARFGKVAVDDADTVGRIERGAQRAARLLDRSQVPRRDVAGRADQGESWGIRHGPASLFKVNAAEAASGLDDVGAPTPWRSQTLRVSMTSFAAADQPPPVDCVVVGRD